MAHVMKMLGGFNIKTKGEKFRFVSLSATLTRVFVFKQENNIKQRHAQFFNPDDVRLGPDKSIQYIDQRCSNSSRKLRNNFYKLSNVSSLMPMKKTRN